MSLKKRIMSVLLMWSILGPFSVILGYVNDGAIDWNHLIGMLIAGFIIGFWFLPRSYRKEKRKREE
ncbi:hypothetical protein GLW04_02510 [Halobacillus litoralis]|uniref:Uncharacterized protein n=1 Tax=Halobacillus litoralis TaxID=45668 RepID=A0A845DN05_9BACI|nr:solute carrier organic anion transporter [Halobacillus litoralis]MYL18743.1 hypothetical protein [Halobacillus litoralis]